MLQTFRFADGSTVYVTLYSLVGGQWVPGAYTYTAFNASSSLAVMQSPPPGTQINGTQATFTWSAGMNALAYELDIGDNHPGGNNIYQSGLLSPLSATVSDLPNNGFEISATLWTLLEISGQYQRFFNEYNYQSGPSQGRRPGQHPSADQKHYPTR